MANTTKRRALTLIAGSVIAFSAATVVLDAAHAQDASIRRPAAHPRVPGAVRPRANRVAERPLTIRRRARPVAVVGAEPGFLYEVPQHRWNDPRLYYFGPFRTGGDVFYGDEAGNPITRGNSELGMISGYGGARGGYGGPHLDAVGGFHNGPGPDAKIDNAYGTGSLSTPDYAFAPPRYPSPTERVETLDKGVVPDTSTYASYDRAAGRKMIAEGRSSTAASDQAKAAFSAPMRKQAPIEAAFSNGGLPSAGFQIGNDEF